eukprot:TRINITY_DN1161_c0_g1_i1.p1 TRINITY_DN1161_c0_g1~~TRINITY_DN1161_c0_g1_i1.p1  ORF type:complete len:458 (+),score=88.17 TRINITY_DN1161_c0_g1_i1:78-1376(+)
MPSRIVAGLVLCLIGLRLHGSACFIHSTQVVSNAGRLPSTVAPASPSVAAFPTPSTASGVSTVASFTFTLAASAALLVGAAGRARRGLTARRAQIVATRPDQAIPWWDRLAQPKTEPGIGIWAEKLNMTTIFQEDEGNVKTIPATILCVKKGGNIITNKYWPEKHGYYAVQVGYERFNPTKSDVRGKAGIKLKALAKNEIPPMRKLKEFRMRPQDWEKYQIGQKLVVSDIFKEGDLIDVHGKGKDKGFAGRIKRWGMKRGPMTHGSKHHRRYGSVGSCKPARVLPGKRMAGWKGGQNTTCFSLPILKLIDNIDEEGMPETIIVVKGSVPGYTAHWESGGSYVYINHIKNKGDGRFKRDPVWLWYYKKGEGVDPFVPLKQKAWTWKTYFGREMRWAYMERNKYWPDGFPGYNHSTDPFYDDCDTHVALKAPEW